MNVPTAYIDGVNIETSVRQSLSRKKTRSLGAKLVDSETYDFLLTLAQSVVVDVFDGYDANDAPLTEGSFKSLLAATRRRRSITKILFSQSRSLR